MKILNGTIKNGTLFIDVSFEYEGEEVACYDVPFDANLSGEELNISIESFIDIKKANLG